MAAALDTAWRGPLSGLVVTRYGHDTPAGRIETVEAGHPVPDAAGVAATERMFDLLVGLTPDDLVISLISGGGSALLAKPLPGLPLEDLQSVTRSLLRSGAPIREINGVRKQLCAAAGGRLAAAAAPASVVTLAISDVPGDDASEIASGPTVFSRSTSAEACATLRRYDIDAPASVRRMLSDGPGTTPAEGDLPPNRCVLVATPEKALEAAASVAAAYGYAVVTLGSDLEGEAREVGTAHAELAAGVRRRGHPSPAPCVLLSGGETTVTVRGDGRGGRNTEYLLAVALALDGAEGIHALAADTDGIDGTEDNAGALIGPETLADATRHGLSALASLERNDGYGFFKSVGALVVTGPTTTNVNDFRAILIEKSVDGGPSGI